MSGKTRQCRRRCISIDDTLNRPAVSKPTMTPKRPVTRERDSTEAERDE
jgi:hypothetical protein